MQKSEKEKLNPRKVFWKKGTCSQAAFHLLNHEFDNHKPQEEKAADMLAGGIARKGKQCVMIWGGALAVGAESYRKYKNKNEAIAIAIRASKQLLDSFEERTQTVNCRDIVKVDWTNKRNMVFYTLKLFAQGFIYSKCFNLMVRWIPDAIEAAKKGLEEEVKTFNPCLSCASEVVKKMGASEEESVMVSGFAGGIGLSGNTCGALSAAIWYKMLDWIRKNPDKEVSVFYNGEVNELIEAFNSETSSMMLCKSISGKEFSSVNEHSEYIAGGGCENLIDVLTRA